MVIRGQGGGGEEVVSLYSRVTYVAGKDLKFHLVVEKLLSLEKSCVH